MVEIVPRAERVETDVPVGRRGRGVNLVGRSRGGQGGAGPEAAFGFDVAKLLPRPQRAGMAGVDDHAESLVGRDAGGEADEKERQHEEPPPAGSVRQHQDDAEDEGRHDVHDAGVAHKLHPGFTAVADGPADKIGVRLVAQAGLDHVFDQPEGRRVRGVLERVEHGGAVAV